MSANFTAQFLGTGTSVGLPMIGCDCPVCTSADPRDRRRRASLYLTLGDRALLIDAGPDLREACLQWRVPRVDAVYITHIHADHIFGFDDVRRFNTMQDNQVIPCFGGTQTIAGMHRIFNYITTAPTKGLYRPLIDFTIEDGPFEALGAKLTPLPVIHGSGEVNGLRVDYAGHALAYIPDVHEIPPETLAKLQGLDVLILNMLRERPHPTHLTLEQSLAYAAQIQAKSTYFTHLSHDLSHEQLLARCPAGVQPAIDGLRLTLA